MAARKAARRGFGQISTMRSGRYQARYVGPDGAMHTAGQTYLAKIDAEAWLAAERRLIETGTWTPPKHRTLYTKARTFGDYAATWMDGRTLRPRTIDLYRQLLRRLILPTFAEIPVKVIAPDLVRTWHTELGTATPTQNAHAYALLRAILADAVYDGLLTSNPCHIRGGGVTKRKRKIKPLSLDELAVIVEAMPARHRLMVLLGCWCALRYGELTALRRHDIDLKNGVIHVRRGAVRTAGGIVEGPPKTDAGIRDVAIPPHVMPAVREHLSTYVTGRQGLLFPATNGTSNLTPSAFYGRLPEGHRPGQGWFAARHAAKRDDLAFHHLRHTGAVLAAQSGATIADLMARLGHSTPAAAMRYQHSASERDKAIAVRLSELAGGIG